MLHSSPHFSLNFFFIFFLHVVLGLSCLYTPLDVKLDVCKNLNECKPFESTSIVLSVLLGAQLHQTILESIFYFFNVFA